MLLHCVFGLGPGPFASLDPLVGLLAFCPLSVAGGYLFGGWRVLVVAAGVAACISVAFYVNAVLTPDADYGILDGVFLGGIFFIVSAPAAALGWLAGLGVGWVARHRGQGDRMDAA